MLKAEIVRELDTIKNRLKSGELSNQLKMDFWKVVGSVKRISPSQLDDDILDRVVDLHNRFFEKRIVLSYRKGAVLFFVLLVITYSLFIWLATHPEMSWILKTLPAFLFEGAVMYFSFLTGRCLGGFLSGIRFQGFYRYNPVELGVKLDFRSYLKAEQKKRVVLFATPILWEHLILVSQAVLLFVLSSDLTWIPVLFIAVNLPFSYLVHRKFRTGELHRLLRELKILREITKGSIT